MDPVSMNVKGVSDLVRSGLNKTGGGNGSREEGVISDQVDELDLTLDNEELFTLAARTETKWEPYGEKLRRRQDANKAYYLGKQLEGSPISQDFPIASNLIFEAEETFLPAALSKNPEPVVWTDGTKEGAAVANDVKTMLQYHADTQVLRRKMNRMTRQWSVNLLGVVKHGWDKTINDIKTDTRNVRNFVMDPDAYIDEYGDYCGGPLGERIPSTAGDLADMFPKHAAYITVMVDGKMGTKVVYTEWWNDSYCFYTFKGRILDKHKNQFFNYGKTVMDVDEDGEMIMRKEDARNHFARPKMPYTFLSVFSMGEQPFDETGLIEQNIGNQNRITKREDQIDKNLDKSNNSIGLSGQNFNEETAKQAAVAMQKGNPVLIPTGGPVSEAIARFPAPSVPDSVFKSLENNKNDLRSIFGTQGITAQEPDEDQTARGMILNQGFDTTRIGGGIGDALEQVADNIFNWWAQLYYVFYDESHYAAILGRMKAVEYVSFSNRALTRRLVISVAPGSMKPKDEVTEMNQAMALWDKGAMDPKTLFTILDYPDPQEMAEQVVLWKIDPQMYMRINFPEMMAKLQQAQMQAQQEMQAAASGIVPAAGEDIAPEDANGEPPGKLSTPAKSAALSEVPLPTLQ